ncbi:hypothetical protein [Cellvibrio mixtus]|uniref:hypothetical protein n=1 Tax=Cellvibrio mixtus TaxID=39650 RepID=UPI00190F70C1|nr:hypothetical protein [Cellvibrio mixtus]
MALPDTTHRVALHTSGETNQRIAEATQRSIAYYRNHPVEIPARLKKLDREWDIERVLETNASTLIVISCIFGFIVHKLFFIIPLLVGAFLLQHALQGWCPPPADNAQARVPHFIRNRNRTQSVGKDDSSPRCKSLLIR